MRTAKLIMLFAFVVVPVHRCRRRRIRSNSFVTALRTGKLIKLHMEAQEQIQKGDTRMGWSNNRAGDAKRSDTVANLLHARQAPRRRERRYELAIEDCSWVLRKYPNFIEAALLRAQINADLGKYAESLKELDHLVRIRPHLDSYARTLSSRAWLLATCPNRSFRKRRTGCSRCENRL